MKSRIISNNKKHIILEVICFLLLTLYITEKYILPQLVFINADFFVVFRKYFWWFDVSVGNIFRYIVVILLFQIIRSTMLVDRKPIGEERVSDTEGANTKCN